jgi:ATPase family associated with various cellular activities (AAA)
MDAEQQGFVAVFREFLERIVQQAPRTILPTPFGRLVGEHLDADAGALPVVTEDVAAHRLVDLDLAMESLSAESEGRVVGVSHGNAHVGENLGALLAHEYVRFDVGPVEYVSRETSHDTSRQVVAFGVWLFHCAGAPVVALQRAARPEVGQSSARLEVLAVDPVTAESVLREVRERMTRLSVLRGKVLSFTDSEFGHGGAGMTFLPRPDVGEHQIVLAEGVLASVLRHVVGVGEHRDRLVEAGQHLKRGVLFYGPPGTGKTLTVRHLVSVTEGTTAVLLTGPGIRFITEAADVARAMQPSIVVLEDVDLVAGDRSMHYGPQPLLFSILDALDGLDGDADVTFILTTNRVADLERALVERPGRIDLAVEFALPAAEERRRMFALYARGLPLSEEVVAAASDRADGVTGSFAKELMRRIVLAASEQDRDIVDSDVIEQLDGLLSDRETLTRNLLGGSAHGGAEV